LKDAKPQLVSSRLGDHVDLRLRLPTEPGVVHSRLQAELVNIVHRRGTHVLATPLIPGLELLPQTGTGKLSATLLYRFNKTV